jgi:hypothetical protein
MIVHAAVLLWVVAAMAGVKPVIVVHAADTPVRIDRATVVTTAEGPPVLIYAATNTTDDPLEQFTVMAFVFNAQGMLKARQVAPGRRTLDARSTKYSTMVLDGGPIDAADQIVIGVNQAQRVGSDAWWRSELQPAAAEAATHGSKP